MIRFLGFIAFLCVVGAVSAWVSANPGMVSIQWLDYQIDTSPALLLLGAVVVAFVFAYLFTLVEALFALPRNWRKRSEINHYKKGLTELTYSVAALAASDVKQAARHTQRAEKLLGTTPLTILLSAQIAKSEGDEAKTRALLEQLLQHKETEFLAARSLSDAAGKQERLPQALELAERAFEINKRDAAALISILDLHLKMGKWQEAMQDIAQAARSGALTSRLALRYKGLVHFRHAQALADSGRIEEALPHARYAAKLLSSFAPVVLLGATLCEKNGFSGEATSLLLKFWKKTPHPDVRPLLRELINKEPERRRTKLLALLNAPDIDYRGVSWVCRHCGHTSEQWLLDCPSCGGFDSLEWK